MSKIKVILSTILFTAIIALAQLTPVKADLLKPTTPNDEIIGSYTKNPAIQKTPTFTPQEVTRESPLLKDDSQDGVAYTNKPDYSISDGTITNNTENQSIIADGLINQDDIIRNGNNDDITYNENTNSVDPNNSDTYTVYVSNAYQFLEAIYDLHASGATTSTDRISTQEQSVSHISKIVLTKDIDLTNLPQVIKNKYILEGSGDYSSIYTRHFKLTIDGQDPYNKNIEHSINLGAYSFAITGDARNGDGKNLKLYKEDWTWKNIHMYGQSWWGPTAANTGYSKNAEHPEYSNADLFAKGGYTKLNFENCTYIGCQLHNSYSSRSNALVTIKGRVSASSVKNFQYNGKQYVSEDKNQQIFEASKIRFEKNSYFTGYTYDSPAIELNSTSQSDFIDKTPATSSMTLEDGAKVFIYPHGDNSMERAGDTSPYGMPYGLVTQATNSQLIMNGNSQLNFISNDAPAKGQYVGDESKYLTYGGSINTDTPTLRESNNLAGAIYLAGSNQIRYKKDDSGSPTINVQSNDQINMNYDDTVTTTDTSSNGLNKYENGTQEDEKNLIDNGNITAPTEIGNEANYNNNYSKYVNYLYSKGQDQSKTGATYNSSPLVAFLGKGDIQLDHGTFSIVSNNMDDFGGANVGLDPGNKGSIMYVGGTSNIDIKKDGIFKLLVDGSYPDTIDGGKGGVINLLTAANGLSLKISNPEQITLDAGPNNNENTHIVYVQGGSKTDGGGDVDLQDSTFSAWGNTSPIKSPAGDMLGTDPSKDIKLLNIPIQRIDIPFTYWSIPANLFQNGHNAVYARNQLSGQSDLNELNSALSSMNGKEFHKIEFGKLDSPKINNTVTHIIPNLPKHDDDKIDSMTIAGTINHYDGDTPFTPAIPLISLKIEHHAPDGSVTTVDDLGTINNSDQAYGISPSNTTVPVSVTPNILGIDDKGKQTGVADVTGSLTDVTNPMPKYLNVDSTKDGPSPLIMSKNLDDGTANDYKDSYNYQINVQQAIKNYNNSHQDNPIPELKSSDVIQVGAVTNFQSTPLQNIKVTDLFLSTTTKTDKYLLGDTVRVPVTYFDGNTSSTKVNLTGSVTSDSDTSKSVSGSLMFDQDEDHHYDHNSEVTKNWNISGIADKVSSINTLTFNGQDDATPINKYPFDQTDKPLTYNYQVLPYPKYNGKKYLTKVNHDGKTIDKGANTLETDFTPVGHHDLSNVQFVIGELNGDSADAPAKSNGSLTITATTPAGKSGTYSTTTVPDGNTYNLTGTDFGFGSATLPADTTFTIKQPVTFPNDSGSFTPSIDYMNSKSTDGTYIQLAESAHSDYGIGLPDLSLTVPQQLDYSAILKGEEQKIFPKKLADIDPQVTLTNNYVAPLNVQLTAQVNAKTSTIRDLFYFQEAPTTADSTTNAALAAPVTVLDQQFPSQQTQKLTLSTDKQAASPNIGPYLQIDKDDSSLKALAKEPQSASITWTATNSLVN